MVAKPFVLNKADPEKAPVRLMVVPHAGAGASSVLALREHVPKEWLVAAVRLPGRESRIREPVPDLEGLVADVVASARALPGRAPLIVLGVCSGAVIGLEAVRALQDGDPGMVTGFVAVSQWALNEVPEPGGRPNGEPGDASDVLEDLKAFGALPDGVPGDDLMSTYLPVIAADVRAVKNHYADPRLSLACPILVVAGKDDGLCSEDRLSGWSLYGESVRSVRVPGGHMLLAESPAVLADSVAGNLDHFGLLA